MANLNRKRKARARLTSNCDVILTVSRFSLYGTTEVLSTLMMALPLSLMYVSELESLWFT